MRTTLGASCERTVIRFGAERYTAAHIRAMKNGRLFMDRLQYYFEGTLRYNNGLDVQTSLGYRVFEDREHLGGAYRSVMRLHCMQCVIVKSKAKANTSGAHNGITLYCSHVDQDSLQSRAVMDQPAPPAEYLDNVNLVCLEILGGMRPEGFWSTEYRIPPEISRL
jgi:hypothetical protein